MLIRTPSVFTNWCSRNAALHGHSMHWPFGFRCLQGGKYQHSKQNGNIKKHTDTTSRILRIVLDVACSTSRISRDIAPNLDTRASSVKTSCRNAPDCIARVKNLIALISEEVVGPNRRTYMHPPIAYPSGI